MDYCTTVDVDVGERIVGLLHLVCHMSVKLRARLVNC